MKDLLKDLVYDGPFDCEFTQAYVIDALKKVKSDSPNSQLVFVTGPLYLTEDELAKRSEQETSQDFKSIRYYRQFLDEQANSLHEPGFIIPYTNAYLLSELALQKIPKPDKYLLSLSSGLLHTGLFTKVIFTGDFSQSSVCLEEMKMAQKLQIRTIVNNHIHWPR